MEREISLKGLIKNWGKNNSLNQIWFIHIVASVSCLYHKTMDYHFILGSLTPMPQMWGCVASGSCKKNLSNHQWTPAVMTPDKETGWKWFVEVIQLVEARLDIFLRRYTLTVWGRGVLDICFLYWDHLFVNLNDSVRHETTLNSFTLQRTVLSS